LLIPGIGILYGVLKNKIYKPFYERYIKEPLYVDEQRCCR
jgi:hypothetical protein